MDFDLFVPDEDDDILSTVSIEPTQRVPDSALSEKVLEFQCSGEDSLNSQFSAEGFIKNGFIVSEPQPGHKGVEDIVLSTYNFRKEHLDGSAIKEYIFGEACMNIQYLMSSVRGPIDAFDERSYYERRHEVTQLLHVLLETTHAEQWPLVCGRVTNVRNLLNRVTEPDIWRLIYFANSCKGNECNMPAYHLLHGALEWKLLDLCILHKYDSNGQTEESGRSASPFSRQLERVFEDLLACSLFVFAKKRSAELLYSSPFPCTCFKEFWLLLQFALQKWRPQEMSSLNGGRVTFWSLFNEAIERMKAKADYFSLTTGRFWEFSNWMLHALVRLHGYRSNGKYEGSHYTRATAAEDAENYEFLERNTQQFLQENPKEEQLRIYICLLSPTLLQWWRPKVQIPMVLWEHFHKRINSSFYIAGAAPSNLAVSCASGSLYLEKYRSLLLKEPDGNVSSYTLFTLLLAKCLEHLLKSQAKHQAQKLLGRIYSKFSAQKFLALNETGIHHLIELFLVMALCGDFDDIGPKLRDKLLSITLSKITGNKQVAVAKGHMALLILYAEHRCDFTSYVTKLLQQLAAVRNDLAVSKVFADALLDVFEYADDFRRGEHLLIDAWIPNFLNNCTPAEQERTLEALHLIFVKMQRTEPFVEASGELCKALNAFILPFLKQQYVNNFSQWLPQLAADFCTHSHVTDVQNFQKLFVYFIEAPTASRQASAQFLLKVLESDRKALVDATIVMQVWLKSLVLLTAHNEEVANLTKIVVQLPDFRLMTAIEPSELVTAKEPLCVFVAAVGKQYEAAGADSAKRNKIANNFNAYIQNFEKWTLSDLKVEKSEIGFRFYSFLAIVIYNCPHIVYTKSKITCFFHIALSRYIMPTSIQMGKNPEGRLAQLIHKIWPVLVQGVGRLNFKTDAYVAKALTDLVQKWTPHFKISPNPRIVARPFIACLQGDNYELSLFVFEKLTSMFLATQRRQADANACLVVTIFQEIVDEISSAAEDVASPRRLEVFMKGTCLLTLEHIMMVDEVVPSRPLLLEFFKRLLGSAVYQQAPALKDLLAEHLRLIAKKHLAYYTFFYFDLLTKLAQISFELVEGIMDFLVEEVRIVEQKRGAGEDNRIRGCLQKLRQTIEVSKQKSKG